MNSVEIATKAGHASALARQSPKLAADKAQAIALHQAGKDTGSIARAIPGRHRTEIRRWLIAAGIYRTEGRGKCHRGRRRFNAIRLLALQYSLERRQQAATDETKHWKNHPAVAAHEAWKWYYSNHTAALAKQRRYNQRRTPAQITRQRIAARIRKAMKQFGRKARKTMRTHEYIGCSIGQLREHLEKQFSVGMTWANYGKWHIDHRRPCASFDLSDKAQQLLCYLMSISMLRKIGVRLPNVVCCPQWL